MKGVLNLGCWLLLSGAVFGFVACGDDDDATGGGASAGAGHGGDAQGRGGAASDGSVECAVLGELCHEADTGPGPAHDCHEIGHEGEGAQCLLAFRDCTQTCVPEAAAGGGSGIDVRCAALGELCHPVDDKTGPLHDCHELGHDGEASACAAAFADCAARCLAAREALETPAGAAGGASGQGGATAAAGSSGNAG